MVFWLKINHSTNAFLKILKMLSLLKKKDLSSMEKYTNSKIRIATRIRRRRTKQHDGQYSSKNYTQQKAKHYYCYYYLKLISYYRQCMYYVLIIDCDDKTLVMLLEELHLYRTARWRTSRRYQTGSANPIKTSKTTEKLMQN